MDIALGYLLKALVLPPCGNLLLALLALAVRRRQPRTSVFMLRAAFGSLIVLMMPLIGTLLAVPLEAVPSFAIAGGNQGAEAIVVLGGGRYPAAPEYNGTDTVHPRTLERLRYAAFLQRALKLPMALVGGDVTGGNAAEGLLMLVVMDEAFKVPVEWVEAGSRNTAENAEYTRYLLPSKRILLVTHALHMRRAQLMFEAQGFEVIPAPLGFRSSFDIREVTVFDFLPSVQALQLSHDALHEYLGLAWYRFHYLARAG